MLKSFEKDNRFNFERSFLQLNDWCLVVENDDEYCTGYIYFCDILIKQIDLTEIDEPEDVLLKDFKNLLIETLNLI